MGKCWLQQSGKIAFMNLRPIIMHADEVTLSKIVDERVKLSWHIPVVAIQKD